MGVVSKEDIRRFFDSGNFEETVVYGERLLRVYPEDCELRYLLGMAYIYLERYEDAERVLSRAVMLDANSPRLLLAVGKLYLQLRRYKTAYRYLQRAQELSPEDRDILLTIAYLYDETEQYAQAIDVFRKLTEMYTEDAEIYNDFGVTLLKEGLIDDALAKFERAVKILPSFLEAWENIALVSEYKGFFDKAVEARRRIVELRGSCDDFVTFGEILMNSGKYLQALRFLEWAKLLYPESPEVHYGIAKIYLHEESWKDALEELKIADKLGLDKGADFYRAKTVAYFNLKLFEDVVRSVDMYESAGGLLKGDMLGFKVRALMYLKKWKDVVDEVSNMDDIKLVYFKGIALYKLGRYKESLEFLQKAYDAGIVNENICRQLARAYRIEGDRESSIRYWKRLLDISPGDKEAKMVLSQSSAEKQVDIKTVVNPAHIERHRMLARKYENKGMVKEALLEWKKVLLIDPYDLEALEEVERQRG